MGKGKEIANKVAAEEKEVVPKFACEALVDAFCHGAKNLPQDVSLEDYTKEAAKQLSGTVATSISTKLAEETINYQYSGKGIARKYTRVGYYADKVLDNIVAAGLGLAGIYVMSLFKPSGESDTTVTTEDKVANPFGDSSKTTHKRSTSMTASA